VLIKKILCPIDLFANTKTAMAYAISLAQENKAELGFLYVMHFSARDPASSVEPDPVFSGVLGPRFSMNHLFKKNESRVENLVVANFGREIMGLSWKVVISLGNITREIVSVAVGEKADLIIMARRKRGILGRLFTRRISEAVSDRAPCPVLTIHGEG
jgi:nucleotide-binding universal stress UspA family protein